MTPLQQAIENLTKVMGNATSIGLSRKKVNAYYWTIEYLKGLLRIEKQFARDCFQAGEDYVGELEQGNPINAINFETYYKKFDQ